MEQLRLTPFARAEFDNAGDLSIEPTERARRLVIRSFVGFGSNAHSASPTALKTGFHSFSRAARYRSTGFRSNSSRSGTTPAHDWANYPQALKTIIERLAGVVIESRDAREVMTQHDSPVTLHYVDPPYLPETRAPSNKYDLKHRMYRHELRKEDHAGLLEFLRGLAGMVVLSGYPSALYDEALAGWRRLTAETYADGARPRTEVLWLNPACAAALEAANAAPHTLFGRNPWKKIDATSQRHWYGAQYSCGREDRRRSISARKKGRTSTSIRTPAPPNSTV